MALISTIWFGLYLVYLAAHLTTSAIKAHKIVEERTEGSWIGVAVLNKSNKDFDVTCYEPNHGEWTERPAKVLDSAATCIEKSELNQKQFVGKIKDCLGNNPKPESVDEYTKNNLKKENACITKAVDGMWMCYAGKGKGMGTELAIILTDRNSTINSRIVLLVRKIPGGDYGAGISMSNHNWLANEKNDIANDKDGSNISHHIQNFGTKVCQFSSGEETGQEVSTTCEGITVSIKAGMDVLFEISNATENEEEGVVIDTGG